MDPFESTKDKNTKGKISKGRDVFVNANSVDVYNDVPTFRGNGSTSSNERIQYGLGLLSYEEWNYISIVFQAFAFESHGRLRTVVSRP